MSTSHRVVAEALTHLDHEYEYAYSEQLVGPEQTNSCERARRLHKDFTRWPQESDDHKKMVLALPKRCILTSVKITIDSCKSSAEAVSSVCYDGNGGVLRTGTLVGDPLLALASLRCPVLAGTLFCTSSHLFS